MKLFKSLSANLFLSLLIISCSSPTSFDISGVWKEEALSNREINSLQTKQGILFAGTNDGVYRKNISNSSDGWSFIGLRSDTSHINDIIAWSPQELMVAVGYDEFHPDNIVMYKTENGGDTWESYNENFVGENIDNFLERLALDPENPDRIFALGGLPVARSSDRGLSWEAVYETWEIVGFGRFLKIDPRNTDIIWAGGATNIFSPRAVRSADGGDSWQMFEIVENTDATVYGVATHPDTPNQVLAALGLGIWKTEDTGESWTRVFENGEVRAITQSPGDRVIVYAAGIATNDKLTFFASDNFGDTWQTIEMPDSPSGIQVNDMVAVEVEGREVLYLGTNKGVFSYTFEE